MRPSLGRSVAVFVLFTAASLSGQDRADRQPRTRHFTFDYGAQIDGLKAGQVARIWLPLPPNSESQQIKRIETTIPGEGREGTEGRYGNQILYFEAGPNDEGRVALRLRYEVTRREIRKQLPPEMMPPPLSESERKLALTPDRLGPITGKPLELIKGLKLPMERLALVRVLYDRVDEHVVYDKSRPGFGKGDVNWVCDSRFGNCSDFHSLFMALARSQGIPAKFEIGFPLPDERGQGKITGYHCWAFFYESARGWVPVDISEADKHPELKDYYFGNLTENRVTFSSGRDLQLVPRQSGPPVNFLVYPYVEVDGAALPKDKVQLSFAFADLP